MRTIKKTTKFKRDFKKTSNLYAGKYVYEGILFDAYFEDFFKMIVRDLVNDFTLTPNLRDHMLKGNWKGHRELHVKPDLLLIYKKIGTVEDGELILVRLGSHSELKLC